jgi:hypothetical protein
MNAFSTCHFQIVYAEREGGKCMNMYSYFMHKKENNFKLKKKTLDLVLDTCEFFDIMNWKVKYQRSFILMKFLES